MEKNNILKDFTKYVSLNIVGMIGLSCYILADTFFVAKALGADGLAALNFCISIFSILQGFGLMIGIGGATRYSILKNSGEHRRSNTVFVHSIIFGLCVSVIFVIIGAFFTAPIVTVLGADQNALPLAKIYLTTLLSFAPLFLINNILIAFIRNDNNPKLAMTAMLISSFSNIVLDYIFIFPLSMGMFGAAFATGLSPAVSLCILSVHFWKKKNKFSLCKCRIRINIIKDIVFLGFSSFVGELASAIALITFNLVIFKIGGNTGVAAYGIVANIALIATAVFTGVAQGIQPLASRGYGAGDKSLLKQILRYTIVTTLLMAVIIYSVILMGSETIVSIFNSEGNAVLANYAVNGLKIYFAGFLFAGINIVTAAFLSAVDKAKGALLISMLRSCVLIVPMVIFFSKVLNMNGVWISFVVTELIVCLVSALSIIAKNHSM